MTSVPPASERTRRTQDERRAETRRRVLDAATSLVAQHGSRAVSLEDVGVAAGYSRGIVNHHFGSKARLLETLVEHTRLFDVDADAPTGLGRLTAFIRSYLATLRQRSPKSEAFIRLWAESVCAEPALGALFAERDASFRDFLAQLVRDGMADGSIRQDANPETIAVAVIGVLRGTAMLLLSTARDTPTEGVAVDVAELLEHGLAAG